MRYAVDNHYIIAESVNGHGHHYYNLKRKKKWAKGTDLSFFQDRLSVGAVLVSEKYLILRGIPLYEEK